MPLSLLKRSYLYKLNPQIHGLLEQIAKFGEPVATVNLEKYPFKEPAISLKP